MGNAKCKKTNKRQTGLTKLLQHDFSCFTLLAMPKYAIFTHEKRSGILDTETETRMAARFAIGNAATRPILFQHFQLRINPTTKNAKFSSFTASASSSSPRKLILYSKPGCCLCDGLKEKLDAAFSLSGPNSLNDVQLQIRDITTNPEWERLYQYEIPVLARVREDGTEETLPRLSPRLGVELVQKKIAAAFSQ